jgi:hypothetical protein
MSLAWEWARIVEDGPFGGREEAIVRGGNKERQTGEACYAHTPRFVDVMTSSKSGQVPRNVPFLCTNKAK